LVAKEKNRPSVDVQRWMYSVDKKIWSLTIGCWTVYVGVQRCVAVDLLEFIFEDGLF
jgi:hypothetical protein